MFLMSEKTVCILGGTGFVGHHLCNTLTRRGYRVVVPTRRRERHRALLVNPRIILLEADIHDPATLERLFKGCTAVVNLVGVLNEAGRSTFEHAHVDLARQAVKACLNSGITRLLHMSALNANADEKQGQYLRTKGEAEDLVHAATDQGLQVTSFRPSVIFGCDDSFFNRFALLLRLSPLVFPLACPNARLSPVFVGDVVEAFACALEDPSMAGTRLDLCGPDVYTLRELVKYTARALQRRCAIIGLGDGLSRLQAKVFELVPGKPFSMDNYYSLQKDSVCTNNALEDMGITPTSIDTVVPLYLGRGSVRGRYAACRSHARR